MYFLRQFIGNACGTIGLIHAILNNKDSINLSGKCLIHQLVRQFFCLEGRTKPLIIDGILSYSPFIQSVISFESDLGEKHLGKFLEATKGMSPEDRGKYLETDEVSLKIKC